MRAEGAHDAEAPERFVVARFLSERIGISVFRADQHGTVIIFD